MDIRCVNDTAEITTTKSKNISMVSFTPIYIYDSPWILNQLYEPRSSFKAKIQQKYFISTYIYLFYIITLSQKNWGLIWLNFFLSPRCYWHCGDRIFWLSKQIYQGMQSQMRNDYNPFVRGLDGFDWGKKPRVENLALLSL
jgi:hypothetical protein